MYKIFVVIPNWNGEDSIKDCLKSIVKQSIKVNVIVVDNGSIDKSVEIISKNFPEVELIKNPVNRGFAGGVNQGIARAIELGAEYVATFNNDAVAEQKFIENLYKYLDKNKSDGIATCKLLDASGKKLDSTGDYYTVWGLPYPRGRGEKEIDKYDNQTGIFAASGGASLYRTSMLNEIGYFDEDFFAYYEDVDLSFRAQLADWKVAYVPSAVAYHQIGATSSKIRGFTTYHTLKNLPQLLVKNVPRKYIFRIGSRYILTHVLFYVRAITRGNGWSAFKGDLDAAFLLTSSLSKRRAIQKNKKVSDEYIWNMIVHDLPPNAKALRRMRGIWWQLRGKHE
jgi:GT2 family glycosyltransferase